MDEFHHCPSSLPGLSGSCSSSTIALGSSAPLLGLTVTSYLLLYFLLLVRLDLNLLRNRDGEIVSVSENAHDR